ncbi:MAG: hypothetical protein AVDCRST_MAG91-1197 [uncultured Sphingomonadaceae bacterium]|uniref:Ribonuclease VapC n=1 Tax=uncultured Sphingomonadaceae bacterium TaxID=169976 RepID=A0A6J4SSK5_9SPHN|nr:MAG: hypothetical protein AVDCRST_MAG91-1197 [uncultured Sphingomonadaceae bacterium]
MIGVIDTSVAVKWYSAEDGSDLASRLIEADLVAPDLILVELGQALWRKQRDGELVPDQARRGLEHFAQTVALLPLSVIAAVALDRAIELSHPVNDCVFLVLAERLQLPLITSDHKFVTRCEGTPYAPLLMTLTDWAALV